MMLSRQMLAVGMFARIFLARHYKKLQAAQTKLWRSASRNVKTARSGFCFLNAPNPHPPLARGKAALGARPASVTGNVPENAKNVT